MHLTEGETESHLCKIDSVNKKQIHPRYRDLNASVLGKVRNIVTSSKCCVVSAQLLHITEHSYGDLLM